MVCLNKFFLFVAFFVIHLGYCTAEITKGSSEIDLHAAIIAEELGGSTYNEDIHATVPNRPELITEEWKKCRNIISSKIGVINPPSSQGSAWENSAQTIDELLTDALMTAPIFLELTEKIAEQTGSITNFGVENQHMIKSYESLSRKIHKDSIELNISETAAISKIGDSLRGTLITDTAEKVQRVVNRIKLDTRVLGGKAVFKNYWEYSRDDSGYIGVHAKIFLPVPKQNKGEMSKRYIVTELQIHLSHIMDGTDECVKERAHLLYEYERQDDYNKNTLIAASQLLFLTALRQYLETYSNEEALCS